MPDADVPGTADACAMTDADRRAQARRADHRRACTAGAPRRASRCPSQLAPAQPTATDASTDPDVVAAVQRGLNSLGFLHGESMASPARRPPRRSAISRSTTTTTSPAGSPRELVDLLEQNGAVI